MLEASRPRAGLAVALALTCLLACSQAEPTDETLRNSFAERLATSDFVTDFVRDGDELRFGGPDGEGGAASWEVRIETSLVEPNTFDDEMPYQGRITSRWYADGEEAPYLGSMSALPREFLDRGLGQECWAYWVAAERRWDW